MASILRRPRILDAVRFAGPYARRVLPRVGHNVAQEAPVEFADAIRELGTEA